VLTVRKWRESIILTEAEAENGAMLFIYLNTYNASFYNIHQIRPKQFQHSNQNIISSFSWKFNVHEIQSLP